LHHGTQRCSELLSISLGKKPEARRPKTERNPKSEARNAERLVSRFVLRISGFGLLLAALSRRRSGSDLGHRLCRVLAETEFIGVSTFGFMLPQRLACLFRAALGLAGQGFAIHLLTPVGLRIYSPHEPPGRRQILRVRVASKKSEYLPRYEKKQAFYPSGLCRAGLVIG